MRKPEREGNEGIADKALMIPTAQGTREQLKPCMLPSPSFCLSQHKLEIT